MREGHSTESDRALGHERYSLAHLLRVGRRSAVLGTLLLIGSAVGVLATGEAPPQFTSLSISSSLVNEGQSVTVAGTFTDADATDRHTIFIYWPEDQTDAEKIQLPAGQLSFSVSHRFADNHPPTQFWVKLHDRQGLPGSNDNAPGGGPEDRRLLTVEVRNAPPRFVDSSIVGTASARGVVVEGDSTDPGADFLAMSGTVGNPINPSSLAPMSCGLTKGTKHFRCEYI